MTKRARRHAWLVALWGAAFGFGCSDTGQTQVLTGRIDTTGVLAIRAVSGGDVVTAAQVNGGQFRIELPSGSRYRLEVLTSTGVKQLIKHGNRGWSTLEMTVCVPEAPFDLGGIGNSNTVCDPMTDPNCTPGCGNPPPCMDPSDPSCGGCTNPMDPSCKPPPPSCGGMNEPPCPPPPCMDPMDPNCKPCMPGDPNCDGGGGTTDPNCMDPMDPETCKDPCVIDPMQCGCPTMQPNCWPPPEPPMCQPGEMCDPGGGMTPSNVPSDFGCKGLP